LKALDTVKVTKSKDGETEEKTALIDFSILEFCIPVSETHSLKPVSFTKDNYLWSSYDKIGTYNKGN